MTRFVAFLRAINVGGHTVTMDRLRQLLAELDLADIESFIASGNLVFRSGARKVDALERRIAAHLERGLGYEVATFVRTELVIFDDGFETGSTDQWSAAVGLP